MLLLPCAVRAQTVTFTSPGSHSWTVPAGVTRLDVTAAGAGGGSTGNALFGGPGGPGGVVTDRNLAVTPGQTVSIVVGGGGIGVGSGDGSGSGGGASSLSVGSAWIIAGGGGGGGAKIPGVNESSPPGGAGCGNDAQTGAGAAGEGGRGGSGGVGGLGGAGVGLGSAAGAAGGNGSGGAGGWGVNGLAVSTPAGSGVGTGTGGQGGTYFFFLLRMVGGGGGGGGGFGGGGGGGSGFDRHGSGGGGGSTGGPCVAGANGGANGADGGNGLVTITYGFDLGGTIAGLSGNGLVLAAGTTPNQTLSPPAGSGSFTFPTKLFFGAAYDVSVRTQPAGLNCRVANGSGTMAMANVNTVAITCQPAVGVSQILVDPASSTTLYAGLNGAGVYRSTNGGGSWSAAAVQPTNLSTRALAMKVGTPLYVGTDGGGVFRSADGGVNFTACATQPADQRVRSLTLDAANTLYAGTVAGVFASGDQCATWSALNTGLPD